MFSLSLGTAYRVQLLGRGYSFKFAEIILIIGIISIIVCALFNKPIILYSNDIILFLWIFLTIWSVAILLWAEDPIRHIGCAVAIGEGLLTYIIAINLFYSVSYSFQIAERLFAISLVAQLVVNMWPILIDINSNLIFYNIKHYAITALGNSNYIAIYLEFILIYELIRKARYYSIFVIITAVGLIMTLTRTGLLITFIMVCLIFIREIWKLQFKRIFWMTIVLLSVGLFFFKFMMPLVDVFESSMIKLSLSHSFLSRKELWENALADFSKAPFLGHGLRWIGDPHNTILRALSNLGIIGAIPFLILLLIPIKKLIHFILLKRNRLFMLDTFALLMAYLATLIHSLFEPMFFATSSQIWLGIILAYVTILTNKHNIKSRPINS